MKHDETFNDDILFDRLIDGELAGAERRRLLESLDTRPEGWRRCALAFLEAQSWREEFGQLASASQTKSEKPMPASLDRVARSRWREVVQWGALAASLLLAFGLGWMHNESGIQAVSSAPKLNEQVAIVPPTVNAPNGGKASDALTLYVRDQAGHMRPVRVPLVDAGTMDEQLGMKFQSGLPDAVRDQLKNRGYNVQSKRQYASLWLENGQPMFLPVEDTKIIPAMY